MPVTYGSEKVVKMLYIYYLVWFQEKQEQIKALLNSGSKVIVMNPVFAQKLGFHIQSTNIGAQKIDSSILKTFRMVIADFWVEDKGNRPRFFQEIFLVTKTKFKVILGILFLKISIIDIAFGEKTLR